jgi:hypothetical protein
MIIATSLVVAAFAVAWWRHHLSEVSRQQAELDRLAHVLDRQTAPQFEHVTTPGDDPVESARALCRHIVDCSDAPADERADRVATCVTEHRGAAVKLACVSVPCDQVAACVAK